MRSRQKLRRGGTRSVASIDQRKEAADTTERVPPFDEKKNGGWDSRSTTMTETKPHRAHLTLIELLIIVALLGVAGFSSCGGWVLRGNGSSASKSSPH